VLKNHRIVLLVALAILLAEFVPAQQARVTSSFKIARLKYSGGGDWYNDPSAEVNLLTFLHQNTGLEVDARYEFVEI
jgi:hypothetical protein